MDQPVSQLGQLLQQTADEMQRDLGRLRTGFTQGTVKGDGTEEVVREFLRSHLPASVGVTSGQVVDSTGAISAQLDVIVYDALRTPMLFTSPHAGQHVVPVEGVIAVIEVKTHLQKSQLTSILDNCRSVKSLRKSAFFETPLTVRRLAYGQEWIDLPVHYSVFAFESENMYASELNELQADAELHERIDTICYLDRGANLNFHIDWDTSESAFGPVVRPGGGLIDIKTTERALVLWFASFSSYVAQAECRPIDLTAYLEGDLMAQGTVAGEALVDELKQRGIEAAAKKVGVDPATIKKFADNEPVTGEELIAIFRGGGVVTLPDDAPPEHLFVLEQARKIAEELGPVD